MVVVREADKSIW